MSIKIERRRFLRGVGIVAGAAATAALVEQPVLAQGTQHMSEKLMIEQTRIVDFHCHHVPARFEVTAARTAPPTQRARWDALAGMLANEVCC